MKTNTSKRCIFLLAILFIVQAASAQYTVTKVVGIVKVQATNQPLKPGFKLKDDDMLVFSTALDMVRVIVPGKGIFVITPSPRPGNANSMIVEMMKSVLKVKSREGYLSGRSEESDLIPDAWQTETAVNNRIHVGTMNAYQFDPAKYNVSNGSRFFLQVDAAGSNPQVHALKTSGDTLFLAATDFPPANDNTRITYKIGFFDKEKNSSESLATIVPYLDTTNEMESIIEVIKSANTDMPAGQLRKVCYAEVYEALGKPAMINFNRAFEMASTKLANK
jgi:plastocyanin